MFKKATRPAFAVIAIFALLLRPSVVLAEKPEPADESPSKTAQQVYDNGIEQIFNALRQLIRPVEVDGDFDIKMPTVAKAKPLAAKSPSIVIVVNEKGKVFVEGKELTIAQLNEQVKKVVKAKPGSATVSIRAHPDCLYADLIRVLQACGKEVLSVSFTIADDKPEEN